MNPSSLVYRVLRGKYFVGGNVLNGSLGSSPSFVWRSLLRGMELIDKGLIWRIGDGVSVNVRKKNWIPRPSSLKRLSFPMFPMCAHFILSDRS